jgi:enoyl-CoA hydratase
MLAADIRIAAAGTGFAQMECTQARMPGSGATVRFVRDAGWGQAMRHTVTGDTWDAEEAYRVGLVQAVASDANAALAQGLEIARKIAACAPLSIKQRSPPPILQSTRRRTGHCSP